MEKPDAWRMTEQLHNELGKGDPFAAGVRATRMPMIITDPRQDDNPIIYSNDAFLNLTGYTRDEVYGRNCRFLQGPDTDRADIERVRAAICNRTDIDIELLNYRKDGTTFWNALYLSPVVNEAGELLYFFASQLDMTERRDAERRLREENERIEREVAARTRDLEEQTRELERTAADLRAALSQKTVLLHEVDHRVKNNLQMVAALISIQARRITDPAIKETLRAMLARIEALSTVHRRLYQADDISRFDVAGFAGDLVTDLIGATGRDDIQVGLDLQSVEVPADKAAPVALMINELVTNALKHAFVDGRGGTINLSVKRLDGDLRVEIADDGVGLPGGEIGPSSFGRNLVRSLARQLDARASWHDAEPGTRVEIELAIEHPHRIEHQQRVEGT